MHACIYTHTYIYIHIYTRKAWPISSKKTKPRRVRKRRLSGWNEFRTSTREALRATVHAPSSTGNSSEGHSLIIQKKKRAFGELTSRQESEVPDVGVVMRRDRREVVELMRVLCVCLCVVCIHTYTTHFSQTSSLEIFCSLEIEFFCSLEIEAMNPRR